MTGEQKQRAGRPCSQARAWRMDHLPAGSSCKSANLKRLALTAACTNPLPRARTAVGQSVVESVLEHSLDIPCLFLNLSFHPLGPALGLQVAFPGGCAGFFFDRPLRLFGFTFY